MAKLGRDGRKPKAFVGADVAVHNGMKAKVAIDGQSLIVAGISKTQLGHLTEDGGLAVDDLTQGKIEKRFYADGPAVPVINHRSRTGVSVDASAILREASGIVDHNAPGANKAKRG
jgi:hypothetical protein